MTWIKNSFTKSLSIGVGPELGQSKKFAIQVATLDGYWSVVVIGVYIIYSYMNNMRELFFMHTLAELLIFFGIWLIYRRAYDTGRILIHLTGLWEMFICADAVGLNTGYEFYYFTSVLTPFITFSLEEYWKGVILSCIACSVLIFQQTMGAGLILPMVVAPEADRLMAIIFVMFFTISVLAVVRWRLVEAGKEIKRQQGELIRSSNLIALGEMAGEIAHQINNPLQTLTLKVAVLKDKVQDRKDFSKEVDEHLNKMNHLIFKMGKMIQGLKDLTLKNSDKGMESFLMSSTLEHVLTSFSKKLKEIEGELYIKGDTNYLIKGEEDQLAKVITNLLDNSLEAIQNLSERWIRLELSEKNSFLQLCIMDSRKKSFKEDVEFNISQNILEKNKGRLSIDKAVPQRFILLLPLVTNDESIY